MDLESEVQLDIYTACSLGEVEYVLEMLQSWPINVNTRNGGGWTPLMYACWGTHEHVVEHLLAAGADRKILNSDGQTALQLAAKSGSLRITELTFQKDILDHIDCYGKTALYNAVEYGHVDIVNFLSAVGADINFRLTLYEKKPTYAGAKFFNTLPNELKTMEVKIFKKNMQSWFREKPFYTVEEFLNWRDAALCNGMTPLMVAAMQGQHNLVDVLVTHVANTQTRNQQGFTANQLAARCGHTELAHMLDTTEQDIPDLKKFLESLSLEKYWPIFEQQNIDLESFLNFTEDDLKSVGIKLLGPRRKMYIGISMLKKSQL